MPTVLDSRTSPSLLGQLRQSPTNQAAWSQFVQHYGPRIYAWCHHWGLQEADAQDVTQDVLLRLAAQMQAFSYDPSRSFRGWLRTLTYHAWSDFLAHRRRAVPQTVAPGVLQTAEAGADLDQRLEEEYDRELLEEAMARVRLRVHPRTWQAFHLLAVEGLPGAQAAQRLGMNVAGAFVARSKVQRLLRKEVQRLEGAGPEEEP